MKLDFVLVFLGGLVRSLVTRIAQGLWDELWTQIFNGVAYAEERWIESGRGAQKKTWVLDAVMEFIEQRASLNWLQRQIVKLFVGRVIDAIVEVANEELGKDWVDKVKDLERELAERFPLIS